MLDQSFTANHFADILQVERRKGNIHKEYFSSAYASVLEERKQLSGEIRELKRTKKKDWTNLQKKQYQDLKKMIQENSDLQHKEEAKWLEGISERVNDRSFRIVLTKKSGNKPVYVVPDNAESLFVMKTLQANLKSVFKVQQANRHRIMAQLSLLLNENTPKYIIRTDVHHFYESIPQERLLEKIKGSSVLSKMSVRFIRYILQEYEDKKDVTESKGLGVPRGVGISAYLSEIYMRDIDEKIKHREEVVYYVRYVDDIFIILSHLPIDITLEQYYQDIRKEFSDIGLSLVSLDDAEEEKKKLRLLDFFSIPPLGTSRKEVFTYLGYEITSSISGTKSGVQLRTVFNISGKKKTRIRKRIDDAFDHFTEKTKYSLSEARKDLRDSLRFIAGNYRLSKSKCGIKAGIYYSNDLITSPDYLDEFTKYLKKHSITVYPQVFSDSRLKDKYIDSIKLLIGEFDFAKQWIQHKTYSIPDKRIKEISRWLSGE